MGRRWYQSFSFLYLIRHGSLTYKSASGLFLLWPLWRGNQLFLPVFRLTIRRTRMIVCWQEHQDRQFLYTYHSTRGNLWNKSASLDYCFNSNRIWATFQKLFLLLLLLIRTDRQTDRQTVHSTNKSKLRSKLINNRGNNNNNIPVAAVVGWNDSRHVHFFDENFGG